MRLRARQGKIRVLQPLLRKTAAGSVVIVSLMTALACERGTSPPTPSPVQSPPPAAAPVASLPPEEPAAPAVYQSLGRRDPFRPPRAPTAQKASTVNLRLTGIIRGPHSYYALVESDSSPGMGYVIRENDMIDSARVLKITKDSVVFEVQTKTAERKLLTRYVQKHMLPGESR